jgi:hypothetical protein
MAIWECRDKIDRMSTGFLHFAERLCGGRLYHCCFCRLQFYDRRPMANRAQNEREPIVDAITPELQEPTG